MNHTLLRSLRPQCASYLRGAALPVLGAFALGVTPAMRADTFSSVTVTGDASVAGSLGVGTAAPSGTKLEVAGAAQNGSASTLLRLVTNDIAYGGSGPMLEFAGKVNSGTTAGYASIASYTTNGNSGAHSGDLVFRTAYNGTLTEKLRIVAAGNVGIGTASPTAKLDVAGAIHTQSGTPAALVPGLYGLSHAGIGFAYALDVATTVAYGYGGASHPVFQVATKPYNADFLAAWDASANTLLTVRGTGYVGIGTTAPVTKFHVKGNRTAVIVQEQDAAMPDGSTYDVGGIVYGDNFLRDGVASTWAAYMKIRSVNTNSSFPTTVRGTQLEFGTADGANGSGTQATTKMLITPAGNVGIGITTSTYMTSANGTPYKLSVEGKIHAKEVVVDTDSWSDFVFADNYRNAPLAEVEQHIKEHRHLPGIPSAKEVEEKGVNVGKMQSLLLAKVEELTLHLIEQEKRLQRLEQENAALRANR